MGSHKGLRIVLLSDLHNRRYEHIIKTTAAINPDIIAIAGDFTYGFKQYNIVSGFLSACGNIAPTFVSLGNHDVAEIIEPMCSSAQGVTLLDNSHVDTVVKGIPLRIGGLSSPISKHWKEIIAGIKIQQDKNEPKPQKPEPNTAWLSDFINTFSTSSHKILLCHQPEYYPQYLKNRDINLILSGHAHGGQWRVCGSGIYAPGQGWFPEYSRGVYDGRLVVSAGVSNTTWIPRFFNPREIVVVEV